MGRQKYILSVKDVGGTGRGQQELQQSEKMCVNKYSGLQLHQKDTAFSYGVSHYGRYGTYQVHGYSGNAHCRTAEITCRR